ncbi:MAG: hypothetical protein AAF927_08145 [Bacteroidota bacterium]
MNFKKNALPVLSLGLMLAICLMGLYSCETIDPVIEEVEELDSTFEGTYFYTISALQSSRQALVALQDAYQNQRFEDIGEENMLALIQTQSALTDNLIMGIEAVGRIRCRPPKCPPPNPCDNPQGIVCDKFQLDLSTIADFRLPETYAVGRRIEVMDAQGEIVAKAEEGTSSFVERAVRYQLDVPENLKEGTLMIYEDRKGVETVSTVAFQVPQ